MEKKIHEFIKSDKMVDFLIIGFIIWVGLVFRLKIWKKNKAFSYRTSYSQEKSILTHLAKFSTHRNFQWFLEGNFEIYLWKWFFSCLRNKQYRVPQHKTEKNEAQDFKFSATIPLIIKKVVLRKIVSSKRKHVLWFHTLN